MINTIESYDIIHDNIKNHDPNIAAIDLGTNSCRLLIASVGVINLHRNFFKVRASGEKKIRIVDSFARVIGLGEGVKQTGLLTKQAIDRTVEALHMCNRKLSNFSILKIRAVATEACRQAHNSEELIERIRKEIGIELEIITPQEEARLVLSGCSGVISEKASYGILLDIGGGSTEVVWVRINKNRITNRSTISVIDSMSLPYGVVTLSDTYLYNKSDPSIFMLAKENITQSTKFFMVKNKISEKIKNNMTQIVASSGTLTTLGSMVLGLKSYNRAAVDGVDFKSEDINAVGKDLLSNYLSSFDQKNHCVANDNEELHENEYVNSSSDINSYVYNRIGLLSAGVVIITSIFDAIGKCTIKVADRGVREGILNDLADSIRVGQSNSWNTPPA